ncbi:MAG: hypothetical protein U0401_18990 [Anaerolineae bacterium]
MVASVDAAGPVSVTENGQAVAPIVRHFRPQSGPDPGGTVQGGHPVQWWGYLTRQHFVVAFTAQASADVDPADGFYPFTRQPLPPGAAVTFNGQVTFNPKERGVTVSLSAVADSCSGEELTATFCRVNESNEGNNTSAPLLLPLPALPTPTLTPTPPPIE